MKTYPVDEFVQMPARYGLEAQFGHNDTWPGDETFVHLRTLGEEAASLAVKRLRSILDEQIYAAFRTGKDYVVAEIGVAEEDIWRTEPNFSIDLQFKGRASTPGEFDQGLPTGWRLYRVADWIEGKMHPRPPMRTA